MLCPAGFGIIDSCISCVCSVGEIAFLILAWFKESLISEGDIFSCCNWVNISSSDIPFFCISITLSNVAMLSI